MIKRNKKSAAAAPVAPPAPAGAAPLELPRFSSLWRLFIYPVSVMVPGAGIVLGLLYARQNDREAVNFGRICLVLGLLGAVLRATHGMQGADTLNQPLY